jgi:hypothetical protein
VFLKVLAIMKEFIDGDLVSWSESKGNLYRFAFYCHKDPSCNVVYIYNDDDDDDDDDDESLIKTTKNKVKRISPGENSKISIKNKEANIAQKIDKHEQQQRTDEHYKIAGIEPWDVIDTWPIEQQIGFYRGNLLKYTMRFGLKDCTKIEVNKAIHYAKKLAEVLEKNRQKEI